MENRERGVKDNTETPNSTKDHPLLKMAGTLDPNDPMVQDWLSTIAENRARSEHEPDYIAAYDQTKAIQFESRLSLDQTLFVPSEIASLIQIGEPLLVSITLRDPEEDKEWSEMTKSQFLKGYCKEDGVNDVGPES